VQQQVAAGHPSAPAEAGESHAHAVEGVEAAREDETLGDRARDPGTVPEVGEGEVGLSGDDARHLGLADALDVGQGQADAIGPPVGQVGVHRAFAGVVLVNQARGRRPALSAGTLVPGCNLLDAVRARGGVDVEAEHGDAERAGVVEDEPLGVHPGVMGQHPGEEGCGVVGLQPRRVVGRQGEGRGVRLAEPERGKGLQHPPDPLDLGRRVAARRGGGPPPGLDLLLPARGAHGTAHLVGLCQRDTGGLGDDLEHLLVEDDDPGRLLERRDEARVEVLDLLPAVPGLEERRDHVGLHRPRPEQRDVDDEVLEALRAELADELALPGALDLEAAEGVGGADEPEGRLVVERHLGLVVEVDLGLVDPGDLRDGVGHGGLHADAEDVELEQPEGLDVVLVELAHRETQPARLHRGAVEEPGVGEHHPARVQGDVAGQAVEPLDEVEQQAQTGAGQAPAAQLRELGDRAAGVPGPDVWKGLGDLVDLLWRQAERRADVAHRVAHLVGVHHRDTGDPVAAEPLEDPLVDLGAAGRLDVDVDVGQLRPQRAAEPLHEQVVADRVDPADAEQVVDQGPGARAARGHPDTHLPDEVDHRSHGEEVRRVAELGDDLQLVGQPAPDGVQLALAGAGVASEDGGPAALLQHRLGVGAGLDGERCRLGQVDSADAEVAAGVLGALQGQRKSAGDERVGPAGIAGSDLPGHGMHGGSARQVRGVGDAVEVAGVEDDEPSGGVEDVDHGALPGVDVADGCGQHRGHGSLVGQGEQAGGMSAGSGGALGTAVADHLDHQGVPGQQPLPGPQQGAGPVGALGQQRPPDIGVRAEQHHERAARLAIATPAAPSDGARGRDRLAALAAQVGVGDQPAQGCPADTRRQPRGPSASEHRDPWVPGVTVGAASHWGLGPRAGSVR